MTAAWTRACSDIGAGTLSPAAGTESCGLWRGPSGGTAERMWPGWSPRATPQRRSRTGCMERACHEGLDPLAVAAMVVGGRPLPGADTGDRPGGGGDAGDLHPRAERAVRDAGGSEGPPGSRGAGGCLSRWRPPGRRAGGRDPGRHKRVNLSIVEIPGGRMILPPGTELIVYFSPGESSARPIFPRFNQINSCTAFSQNCPYS